EGVQQDQGCDAEKFGEKAHVIALRGGRLLGGSSSKVRTECSGGSCRLGRTYVLYSTRAARVPRRAVQGRAQSREGNGVFLVPEPVHGLRAPLHVLLRPRVRAAGRPALGRALRDVDPREDERRRSAA